MAKHNEIGKIGEHLAKSFLMKQGFTVLETNYRTRYGEIDIICFKDDMYRFIEVKSISVSNLTLIDHSSIQPEDNFTKAKWGKFVISVETYLLHKHIPHETRFQIDLACVYIDEIKREGRVKLIQNVHK